METLRDYYTKMGLDENLIRGLNKELRVPSFAKLTNEVHENDFRIKWVHKINSKNFNVNFNEKIKRYKK